MPAQVVPGPAAQDLLEGDARLEAGERRTDADVDAVAEGEMPADAAVDVELAGAVELALVAVGGAPQEPDLGAGGDLDAV